MMLTNKDGVKYNENNPEHKLEDFGYISFYEEITNENTEGEANVEGEEKVEGEANVEGEAKVEGEEKAEKKETKIITSIRFTENGYEIKDYTEDELLEIFKGMVKKAGFKITNEALYKARNIIREHLNDKNFGNARFVRNMYEKTVTEHATNTKDKRRKDVLIK